MIGDDRLTSAGREMGADGHPTGHGVEQSLQQKHSFSLQDSVRANRDRCCPVAAPGR